MLKLIKAELYKTYNRAYFYIYLGCIFFFLVSIVLAIHLLNAPLTVYYMITLAESTFIVPVFLIVIIVSTVSNEEGREKTLRNTVSFGIPRNKLYIAKIIVSIILSAISGVVILIAFLGSSFLMLAPGGQMTANFMGDFFMRLLSVLPLYTASIAICVLLGFVIKNEVVYVFSYSGLFVFVKLIIVILSYLISDKLRNLDGFLISTQLSNFGATEVTNSQMLTSALSGILYTIIFIIIGMAVFKRQEIK